MTTPKPIIGISCGDLNGIGIELIIKTFSDSRLLDHCTPVIFASNKAINFYRKTMPEYNFNYSSTKELNRINPKQINLFTCWEEDVDITPGQLTDTGGRYAAISLQSAVAALKQGQIDGLLTAPFHKKNIQSTDFSFTGHTPYLQNMFGAKDVVMLLCAGEFRVGLVTEHVPVGEVAAKLTKEKIVSKLVLLQQSLQKDFGIDKPRIAVLGLNPHAGDEGLIGKEEETLIRPAIREAKNNGILAVGPYSADAFFARRSFEQFDAVLAMYHDQGLTGFKAIAQDEGVNYTAGLTIVRTSPGHGTAFELANKGIANETGLRNALYFAVDVVKNRGDYRLITQNPLPFSAGVKETP